MLLAGIMRHGNVKHNPNSTEYNFLLGLRCSVMSLRQWANGSDIITHRCHAIHSLYFIFRISIYAMHCNSALLSYASVETSKPNNSLPIFVWPSDFYVQTTNLQRQFCQQFWNMVRLQRIPIVHMLSRDNQFLQRNWKWRRKIIILVNM
jgi:hypothetical protein